MHLWSAIVQWHQCEFKVGGTKHQNWWGVGTGVPFPTGEWVWGGGQIFCFAISQWHILVNSEVPSEGT